MITRVLPRHRYCKMLEEKMWAPELVSVKQNRVEEDRRESIYIPQVQVQNFFHL